MLEDCLITTMEKTQKRTGPASLCMGCGHQILDRFILRVFPDLEWHEACLKCAECEQYLNESRTCFIKDGKTLCKADYSRLYGIKCAKCRKTLTRQDYVMRTQLHIYHVQCFRCEACNRQLLTGDEFTFHKGFLLCTSDHLHSNRLTTSPGQSLDLVHVENSAEEAEEQVKKTDRLGSCRRSGSCWSGGAQCRPERGTTRVRTVLSESQLQLLQTCYSSNPRPDTLLKEQLVELTGLSPRVIRVWFQNKRCKDKKKDLAARRAQDTNDDDKRRGAAENSFSAAIPDTDVLMNPLDFHDFQPVWKLLSSFSLHLEGEQTPETQTFVLQSPSSETRIDGLTAGMEDAQVIPKISEADPGEE